MRSTREHHTQEYQFRLAEDSLREAQHLLRAKWFMNSVAHAYQVALRSAAALLYARGIRPQTEKEVRVAFAASFIAPGRSERRFDEAFRELERMRHRAEFEPDHEGTQEESEKALLLAKEFHAEALRLQKEALK